MRKTIYTWKGTGEELDMRNALEYIRKQIQDECISFGEIAWLQANAKHIEEGDTELLEWAGVEEGKQ